MPYQYPLEIAHADFPTGAKPSWPKRRHDSHGAKSAHDLNAVNTLSATVCSITDFWLAKRDGTRISQASFTDEGAPIGPDAIQRACFAPVVQHVRARWKVTGRKHIRTLYLALFRRGRAEPLWTKHMIWDAGGCPAEARTPFNGMLTDDPDLRVARPNGAGEEATTVTIHPRAAEPEIPDGCVTAAASPYKLVLTIESLYGNPQLGVTRRFLYFDVLVHSVEIVWGDQATAEAMLRDQRPDIAGDFRDETQLLQRGILADLREDGRTPRANHQVVLDADLATTDLNAEGADDEPFRLHRDMWGEGPDIPLFADVLVRDSDGRGVDCPQALGGARFLWDWEDTDQPKHDYWFDGRTPQHVKDYVRDALACMIDEAHDAGAAPQGSTNTHRIHGGKRGPGSAPIFPPQPGYAPAAAALVAGQPAFPVAACPARGWAAVSAARHQGVLAGKTGVIFQPSRIAGDIYRVGVYFLPHDPNHQFPYGHTAAQLRAVPGLPHDRTGMFETWRRVHVKHLHRAPGQPECDVATVLRTYEDAGTILDFPAPQVVDIAEWNRCLREVLEEARAPLANAIPWLRERLPRDQPADDPDGVSFKDNRSTREHFAAHVVDTTNITGVLVDRTASFYAKSQFPDFKGVLYFQLRKKNRYVDFEPKYTGAANSFLATRRQSAVVVYVDPTSRYHHRTYDSLQAAKERDPIVAHEIGHALFLEHAPTEKGGSKMHQTWTGGTRNVGDDGNRVCLMNYHPESERFCGICVLRLRGWSVRGHKDEKHDGITVPLTLLGGDNIIDVHPQILLDATSVVVPEAGETTPERLPVRLKVFKPVPGGHAELRRATADIHFFRAPAGGADVFGGANTVNLASNELEGAGLQLYAQAMAPSATNEAVVLTLDARNGEEAEKKLTAVKLDLDVHEMYSPWSGPAVDNPAALSAVVKRNPGRPLFVQNAGKSHERALLTVKVTPTDHRGKLTLFRRGANGKVRVFTDKTAGTELLGAADRSTPFKTSIVNGQKQLWVEGSHVSANWRDVRLGVGVENGQDDGDHVLLTALQLDIEVELPVTPHRTLRMKQGGVVPNMPDRQRFHAGVGDDWDANPPLVLLYGSAPANPNLPDAPRNLRAQGIELRATSAIPGGGALAVQMVRAADDEGTLPGRGANPLPTWNPANPASISLLLDAVGSFHVHAFIDADGSGAPSNANPSVCMNLVIAQATTVNDQSVATSAHAACDVLGNDIVLRTHGHNELTFGYLGGSPDNGPDLVPLHLKTTVLVVGGGPDGRRGLDRVFAGWINNVVDDMAEASYSNGPRDPQYSTFVAYLHDDSAGTLTELRPSAAAPVLDKREDAGSGGGGTACLARSAPRKTVLAAALPNPAPGCHVIVQALDAPLAGWDRYHKHHPTVRIQSTRFRVRFAAFLSLWTDSNGHYGGTGAGSRLYSVLRKVTWKAEGNYRVSPDGPVQQVAPITITIENSQAYAPAAPACTLDMEVCPPTSGDLLMPREHDGTPLGKPW